MSEYPKIETIFERKEDFTVDPTKLKKSVIGSIKEWEVTEKVDGTNIRVMFTPSRVVNQCVLDGEVVPVGEPARVAFSGRTDNAQIPGDLIQYLIKTFPPGLFEPLFQTPVVLYGEGYGAGIQKVGRLYRPDKSFILFDVLVDGQWWLSTSQVQDVAKSLGIDCVPYLGRWPLERIVEEVRLGIPSKLMLPLNSDEGDTFLPLAEGIVARPLETLFDKRHERVIIKLKTKDFVGGKR